MNHNQSYEPKPTPGNNQYDFITNPSKPPKKPFLLLGSGSMKSRLLLIGGIAVLLMVLFVVASTILTSGSKSAAGNLKSLVAQQQELIRVADMGAKAADSNTRSIAITAKLSVQTQQTALKSHLEKNKIVLTKEELASKKDSEVDDALKTATSNNRYDDVFNEVLNSQLTNYAEALQNAYNAAANPTSKDLLSDSFSSTTAILNVP
ncbi:hypothetical protein H0V99_00235 [Candidatus Saccharibacteria bacterium]|nr:hypothetical protein [Candidatus Saccharibacteria bacterium]